MNHESLRRWGRLAAAIAALSFVAISCRSESVVEPEDEWSEQAFVTMDIRHDLQLFAGGSSKLLTGSQSVRVPVLRGLDNGTRALRGETSASKGSRVRVRHHRDKSGKIRTVALLFDDERRLPKKVFAFEDGRLKWITSPTYRQRDRGHYRVRSLTTLFDSTGHVVGQVTTSAGVFPHSRSQTQPQNLRSVPAAGSDATMSLSRPYTDQEEGACWAEWTRYGVAGLALAAASTALSTTGASCLSGNLPACTQVSVAFAAFSAALAAWDKALDDLIACDLREAMSGGGNLDGLGDSERNEAEGLGDITKAVEQFIEDSIARGSYACTENGEHCLYT